MSKETKERVLTMELRETLKVIMQKEVKRLPETLEKLEPKDRVNIVCRLMPYIFPKVETVHPTDGEPLQFNGL